MHALTVDLVSDSSEFIVLEGSLTTVDDEYEASEDESTEHEGHTDLL